MLRVKYGWAGEGKFSALQNMIASSDECILDLNQKHIQGTLALDLGFTFEELSEFISYLTEDCNLLINNEDKITTTDIQETYSKVKHEREKARERKNSANKSRTTPENSNSSDGNEESSANSPRTFKESKVKESKVKESKEECMGAGAPAESLGFPLDVTENSIMSKWNDFAGKHNLAKIKLLSISRMKKVRARLKEREFNFNEILAKTTEQPFLLGENKNNWKVDFDWLIDTDKNYLKVLEDKYKSSSNGTNKNNQGNSGRYDDIGE